MRRIYLDHAATTPLEPRVFEAMLPFLKEHYGNPSSVHSIGRKARHAIEESRERIAAQLGAEPAEIVFTSGGTEADNLALKGILRHPTQHLVTSAVEHKAILTQAAAWQRRGGELTLLQPTSTGSIAPRQLEEAVSENTSLVSLMHVNNELGSLSPIRDLSGICRVKGVVFHCDAVQAAGLFRIDVNELGIDLLSISGHKFYGPKGIGVLYVHGGVDLRPLVEGGGQEQKRRGGTENVAAIVGLAAALDIAMEEAADNRQHLASLRDRLYRQLSEALGDAFIVNTPIDQQASAPHILNISFVPIEGQPLDGEMLLRHLDMNGIMVATGSACTSGSPEPNHVLTAIGRERAAATATLRFSLGKSNTEEEIDYVVDKLSDIVSRTQITK